MPTQRNNKQPGHYAITSGVPADHAPKMRRCWARGATGQFLSKGPGVRFCPACARARAGASLSRAETQGGAVE